MQIPETPTRLEDLDLMRRLKAYSEGTATWYPDAAPVGESARRESGKLYTGLVTLVDKALARLLDRITAREMETFTMHDRMHGNKVAHLMWHIIPAERRERLAPPEIGMLIGAAFLHDVGMALSPAERDARLDPESDLWERLEVDESLKQAIDELRTRVRDENLGETQRRRAERQLAQAEEVLLSQDTRERHATERRYEEVLDGLVQMSQTDPERIPDPRVALSFDGDSFRKKLVEVCVSHGQDAESLVESDRVNTALPRFPKDYPVGCCNVDLHLVAAALRLADILDFDRERTPPVLFHYLLPGPLTSAGDNRSILEWGKHLTISNWHIEDEAIVFRGRSTSHIVHHAVVQFAGEIEKEIEATRATFGAFLKGEWPFILPKLVKDDITPDGYRYVPYRFELDDERVYTLLMGGAIYNQPLVAVRELIQNAVDACKLRDALLRMHEPELVPKTEGRITIKYCESDADCANPLLVVEDTGIGMDEWVLERFFLKVGRSYYRSSEFSRTRVDLRRHGLDFAPVSEFGIGFLSSFLIADQVRVETAMADSVRRDTRKRTLIIDGPTRLIRLDEHDNTGPGRHRGTRVSLLLTRGGRDEKAQPPSWGEIKSYIEYVCQDLQYPLTLVHSVDNVHEEYVVERRGINIDIPPEWLPSSFVIPLMNKSLGFDGQMLFLRKFDRVDDNKNASVVVDVEDKLGVPKNMRDDPVLLRGGFLVGEVPGIPRNVHARVRLTWDTTPRRLYWGTNIARSGIRDTEALGTAIFRTWFEQLLSVSADVPAEIFGYYSLPDHPDVSKELEKYNALKMYELVRPAWEKQLAVGGHSLLEWENGTSGPLPGPRYSMMFDILYHILPRMTRPYRGDEIWQWAAPASEWRKMLDHPLGDIVNPGMLWAQYPENIMEFLCVPRSNGFTYLNIRYQKDLSDLLEEHLNRAPSLFDQLLFAFRDQRPTRFKREHANLIRVFAESVGNHRLLLGDQAWTLHDIYNKYFLDSGS
jgi:hypothetical protein